MSDSQHAEFPPSSLEHWNNCPGFIQAVDEEGYFSERGTKLHKAWETGNLEGLTEDEAKAVESVIRSQPQWSKSTLREFKVNVAGITWGTVDYLNIEESGHEFLMDAKFGRISVQPAQTNIQIWAYSLGVWYELPKANQIDVTIAVPYRGEVTHATFHRKTHYDSFKFYISRIIEKVEQFRKTGDVSMLSYHPKTCSFCSRINCPIKRGRLKEVMGTAELGFPNTIEVSELSVDEISQAKILSNQFKRWAAEVDKRAMELSNEGEEIPGFERKFMSGRRKNALLDQIKETIRIASSIIPGQPLPDIWHVAGEIHIAKVVELIRENSPRGHKETNEEKFLDALRDADIGQPQGGYYYLKPKPEIYDENKE
jgi:hypothetical protein